MVVPRGKLKSGKIRVTQRTRGVVKALTNFHILEIM
jgi:hypothetical protein